MSTNKNKEYQERRAFPRHSPKDSSAVMLSPDSIISFCVLDISKTGLAFCYNGQGLESNLKDKAFVAFFGEKTGAPDIPVKIISDDEIPVEQVWLAAEDDSIEIPYLRRCGVEFEELSQDQEKAINEYIQGLGMN